MANPLDIRFFTATDIGLKRKRNEDACAVYRTGKAANHNGEPGILFIVADGIGGNACGDLASQMACQGLKDFFSDPGLDGSSTAHARRIEKLIRGADTKIREHACSDPACLDMGTTLTALEITADFALTAHVGDSRIYRLRNGRLSQLTTDHTFVQEMIDEGEVAPERAATHPLRNMLTHAVGTQELLEKVDITVEEIIAGDRFLVCSDGLHDMVDSDSIADALTNQPDPEAAAKKLVQTAMNNGGRDNIAVVAVFT